MSVYIVRSTSGLVSSGDVGSTEVFLSDAFIRATICCMVTSFESSHGPSGHSCPSTSSGMSDSWKT